MHVVHARTDRTRVRYCRDLQVEYSPENMWGSIIIHRRVKDELKLQPSLNSVVSSIRKWGPWMRRRNSKKKLKISYEVKMIRGSTSTSIWNIGFIICSDWRMNLLIWVSRKLWLIIMWWSFWIGFLINILSRSISSLTSVFTRHVTRTTTFELKMSCNVI